MIKAQILRWLGMGVMVLGLLVIGSVVLSPRALAREVTFEWDPMEQAIGYEIQVAKKRDFKEVFFEKKLEIPNVSTELAIGIYFYRVRAVDQDKTSGRWSDPVRIVVAPYAPELLEPAAAAEFSYFEVPPKITLTWKTSDQVEDYDISIYKTTGQKILETRTKSTSFTTEKLTEGEYQWKVRSRFEKIFESDYSEPRKLVVNRIKMEPPQLLVPAAGQVMPAYRSVDFEWTKDPATKYSDLTVTKVDSKKNLEAPKNVTGTTSQLEYLEPGEYSWTVNTKEEKTTPGITTEPLTFSVRNDLVATDNYGFQYGYGYAFLTNSYRSTRTGTEYKGLNSATALTSNFNTWVFLGKSVGLSLDMQSGQYSMAGTTLPLREFTGGLRLRFGVPGFNQFLLLGYRQSTAYEVVTAPTNVTNSLTNQGFYLGTEMLGTVKKNWRLKIAAGYFSPQTHQEDRGVLVADHYEGNLGVSWNFAFKFWFNYGFKYSKGVYTFRPKGYAATQDTSWDATSLEPLNFSFSLEH